MACDFWIIFGFSLMKKFFLLLFFSLLQANDFITSLKNGEISGDVGIVADITESKPSQQNSDKYRNNAFIAGSLGLYYQSGLWHNLRANLGFRSAIPLYQASKQSAFSGGLGSAARDFWDKNIAMLARSHLEYFDGDTNIKLGRIENGSDMISNHFDGIYLSNHWLDWLFLEFFYMHSYGTVLDRELSGFSPIARYENGNIIGKTKSGGGLLFGCRF